MEPGYIVRRAAFLLDEARQPDRFRDQTVTYALRVLSNYAAIGRDAGSRSVKLENPRMSAAARDLRSKVSLDEWIKGTVNEHPEPLALIWAWIVESASVLQPRAILERMAAFPMVTVTKSEDASLRRERMHSSGRPYDRYLKCGIDYFPAQTA